MSSMTWRQVQQVHVTATGNSYAYIKRGERTKRPQEIIPLMPSSVTPIRKNGEILYEITLDNGEKQTVDAWRILHIPGMGFDGLVGYSPIRMAADNIGLSLAAQEFGGKFFGNGASPGGVLEHPKNIGDKAWERLKAGYDSYGGLGNAHKTLILEEGMKLHQTVIPPEEAQFLETRKFQVEDIARIYGVPLIMLSATEKATSWGTGLEQQNLGFLIHTLR
ncbi:MAG: phage portal protein, partial [Herbaspirillum sp.]|nr:phage portal protein [Herbaspirillum sp.]